MKKIEIIITRNSLYIYYDRGTSWGLSIQLGLWVGWATELKVGQTNLAGSMESSLDCPPLRVNHGSLVGSVPLARV